MSIQDLIDLQNIDSELKEIEDLLGDLPSKVFSLKNEEKSLRASHRVEILACGARKRSKSWNLGPRPETEKF